MNTKKILKNALFTLIALLPFGYLKMVWDKLPAQVATHFDIQGNPNGWTAKDDMWGLVALLAGINLFCYFLLQYIDKIDPKRANKRAMVFNKLSMGLVIFMTTLSLFVIASGAYPEKGIANKAIIPLMGVLFVFLGNYIYSVKPNYFVGFRLPWTLHSDYNWQKTHQLGGVLWFAGGILLIVAGLFLPPAIKQVALVVLLAIMIISPIAYSFILFKKEKNGATQ